MIDISETEEKEWKEDVNTFAQSGWLESVKLAPAFDQENAYGYLLKFISLYNCAEILFDDPEVVTVGLSFTTDNPKLHTVMEKYRGYLYQDTRILKGEENDVYIIIEIKENKVAATSERIYIKNPKIATLKY